MLLLSESLYFQHRFDRWASQPRVENHHGLAFGLWQGRSPHQLAQQPDADASDATGFFQHREWHAFALWTSARADRNAERENQSRHAQAGDSSGGVCLVWFRTGRRPVARRRTQPRRCRNLPTHHGYLKKHPVWVWPRARASRHAALKKAWGSLDFMRLPQTSPDFPYSHRQALVLGVGRFSLTWCSSESNKTAW